MQLVDAGPEHADAIRRVVADAFGRPDEARLVDRLRSDGDLVISIVAEVAGEVCGHVALSRLVSPAGAMALAPLSVLPARQRRGIGSALVRRAIERARAAGCTLVFVLGNPALYTRFGFSAQAAAPFPSSYSGPHFMATSPGTHTVVPGAVVYPAAFDELE